jgi:hypothetical protein
MAHELGGGNRFFPIKRTQVGGLQASRDMASQILQLVLLCRSCKTHLIN